MKKILFENVSLSRNGRIILQNISFSVQPEDCIAVYGPNGAGKTTLLNLVNGLILTFQGKVIIEDTQLTSETAHIIRLITGYVPQNFEVDPRIPILTGTVVLSGCYGKVGLFKYPDSKHIEKAKEIMEKLEILDLFSRPFGQISGGEKQKTMIARAMMQDPEILLLDEPFSSISESSKEKIIKIIMDWQKEKKLTMIVVAHEKSVIKKMCNRILYLEDGEIVSTEEINGNS